MSVLLPAKCRLRIDRNNDRRLSEEQNKERGCGLCVVVSVSPCCRDPGWWCCIYVNSTPDICMNDDKCGGNIGLFNYQPLPSSYLLPSQIYIELHRPMSGGCWRGSGSATLNSGKIWETYKLNLQSLLRAGMYIYSNLMRYLISNHYGPSAVLNLSPFCSDSFSVRNTILFPLLGSRRQPKENCIFHKILLSLNIFRRGGNIGQRIIEEDISY